MDVDKKTQAYIRKLEDEVRWTRKRAEYLKGSLKLLLDIVGQSAEDPKLLKSQAVSEILRDMTDRDLRELWQVKLAQPPMKNSPKVQIKVVKAKKSVNAKKTKKAMDKLKKTGKVFTGGIYGWNALKNGTLVPNWKEQWNIQCMRNRRAEGASWAAIARVLNEKGIKGKRGGKWQSGGVRRIAENSFHERNIKNYKPPLWFAGKKKPLAFKK
ncbi:MAG: hypothetical protein CMB45_05130 [Euryarchaeota archaeon]|nr:hypothetical protein [Euryarchaeota archaeon]|tara:strand:- start:7522 stop:8157 length:636 start_codon:yes stop_codon:yes gene_type:complete